MSALRSPQFVAFALAFSLGCGGATAEGNVASNEAARGEAVLLRFEPAVNQTWSYLALVEMSGFMTGTIESRLSQHVVRASAGEFEIVSTCHSLRTLQPAQSELPCTPDEVQIVNAQGQPQGNAAQRIRTMLVYPNEPVRMGSTWNDVLRYSQTDQGERTDFELTATYSLTRFEGVGAERLAMVHLDGMLHTQAEGGAVGDGHIESDFGVRVRDGVLTSMDMFMPLEIQAGSEHVTLTTRVRLSFDGGEPS